MKKVNYGSSGHLPLPFYYLYTANSENAEKYYLELKEPDLNIYLQLIFFWNTKGTSKYNKAFQLLCSEYKLGTMFNDDHLLLLQKDWCKLKKIENYNKSIIS